MLTGGKKNDNVTPSPTLQESAAPETEPTAMDKPEGSMQQASILLTSSGFEPNIINIKVGEKVVWTNKSGGDATVDSAQHPTHLVYPSLNLGTFDDGKTVELVFDEAGIYKYHDHLNPSRFGTVVVE